MIRFGLCCTFKNEPIRFRQITAKYLEQFSRETQLEKISRICRHNAVSLQKAIQYCWKQHIMSFRINSRVLPLKTHPDVGYTMEELVGQRKIIQMFNRCGSFCQKQNFRTSFHPDQFILLSSPRDDVIRKSVADLIYHAEVAQWVNADVINIHGGGAYGDKHKSLVRLRKNIERLPEAVRSRLTLENDDRVYTPKDLFPVCKDMGIPLVYDVHHHRCLPDGISIEKTTEMVLATWDREPLFHISSPKNGWGVRNPRNHHDYIDSADLPECWMKLDITVEVEAKAKELAVIKLKKDIDRRAERSRPQPLSV